MAKKRLSDLPTKSPGEMLELFAVIVNPRIYRGVCELLTGAITREWQKLNLDQQRAAVAEMDRRRKAVKGKPDPLPKPYAWKCDDPAVTKPKGGQV